MFWVYSIGFLSSIFLHNFSIFPGCSAPRNIIHTDVVKWLFFWLCIDTIYCCFSGFAACVGDAAGTWGSIVCVFASVCLWVVGFSSVCLCWCVSCAFFFFFSFLICCFPFPVCACVMLCLWFCHVECLHQTFSGSAWCSFKWLNLWFGLYVYYCINICVCVYRSSITSFGQFRGNPCADRLQWERHGLPPQRLPGSTPPHPVRCE